MSRDLPRVINQSIGTTRNGHVQYTNDNAGCAGSLCYRLVGM